ncbi:Putative uncharacterized protein [Moritella viscosa]|uniref:Uncharacterized protein n=1 Tax=Moritella viscosa TaxID=80854 RepID=A0A1L0AEV3_9GAMM|nr:Putative uncharacterized protein [Moritella viscosa]
MTFLTVTNLTFLSGTYNSTAHNSNVIMLNTNPFAILEQANGPRSGIYT